MEIKTKLKELASRLKCEAIYETLSERLKLLECDKTRITVTGSPSVGKSSLINALTGSNLEVSVIPTGKTTRLVFNRMDRTDEDTIVVTSEWMSKGNLEICELPDESITEDTQMVDYGIHFAETDVCIFMLNGMMALSCHDVIQLEMLNKLGIPTLLLVSKAEKLQPDDVNSVYEHVMKNVEKYSNIKLLAPEIGKSVEVYAPQLRNAIDELTLKNDVKSMSRASMERLFLTDATVNLLEACSQKLETLNEKKATVEKMITDKRTNLSESTNIWLTLQNELMQRRNDTVLKIKDALKKRETEAVRQLTHCVDMCNDVKLFWDKELPYRLEDVIRLNTQVATQLINADALNVINWLNAEIRKSFKQGLNSIKAINCTIEPEPLNPTDDPQIADNKKVRIVARVGTVATVIAAGTMFATMGVGGVVLATSMLAGLGSELFMNRKQSESKKKVIALIPQVVEQAQQKLIIAVSDNMGNTYDEILKNLRNYQGEWMKASEASLEKERQIALYNCDKEAEVWNACLADINEISNQFK